MTGRPKTSTLHIHPLLNSARDLGGDDPEISTISSAQFKTLYSKPVNAEGISLKKQNNAQWHSDIAFEPVPADYTSLRLTQLPKTGGGTFPTFIPPSFLLLLLVLLLGDTIQVYSIANQPPPPLTSQDTLWASGYEVYDRISEPYQKFLEGLSATFKGSNFRDIADRLGLELYAGARGAPENVGTALQAVHPVVRTNPVTGWKSIFPVGGFARHINGLTADESDHLLKWFKDFVYHNHDLQVRLNWKNQNDIGKVSFVFPFFPPPLN